MLNNPFDSPARDVTRRAGTLPPGRGVNFSPAFEAGSAAQARGPGGGRSMLDDSPSRGNITGRRLFGDHTLASSSAASPNEVETDSLPGGYKVSPTLAELRRMTKTELKTVHDFTVSRPGFGSVRFLPPVNLSEIPNLSTIAGGIVQIRSKECYVYPGKEECLPGTDGMITGYTPGPKAAQGEALNVAAVISLDKCWPLDRATRDPIKDPDHPRYIQHIMKLEKKADTKFLALHAATGSWQFQVKHFSRYGLDEDQAEDESKAYLKNPTDAYKPRLKLLRTTQHLSYGHHTARFDEGITSTFSSIEDDDVGDGDEDAPPVEGPGDASDRRPQDTAPIDNIVTDPRHVATHPAPPRGLVPSATPDRSMADRSGSCRQHSREMSQQVDAPIAVAARAGTHFFTGNGL
ncbi:hypothetical protein OC845_006809 [Tilletia horrida]|nr:hypothetical protein OC845_006809 [Tilletia horrida]